MENLLNLENITKMLLSKSDHENKMICVEELAELQIAVTKKERGRVDNDNLIEEMADVTIVLLMLKKLFNISDDELQAEINRKMKRNMDRIKGGI
ncbi:MAG: hypothetical protein ACRCX2_19990 [Paraclostridium sp.]